MDLFGNVQTKVAMANVEILKISSGFSIVLLGIALLVSFPGFLQEQQRKFDKSCNGRSVRSDPPRHPTARSLCNDKS